MPHNPPRNPQGYQPYCPIVFSPNFLPYAPPYGPPIPYPSQPFPTTQFIQQAAPPQRQIPNNGTQSTQPKPNINRNRTYDSYRPNYSKPNKITARNIDVGTVDDEIAELQLMGEATADALAVGTEVILDTGATNHLTGDRSALFHFRLLPKPIPLRVATDGCNDQITGTGTLIFPGKNGITVSVKGVMYCKHARTTLILPAALRRAKLKIDYDSKTDTFLFKSADGITLIESPMDNERRSWTFPQPFCCPSYKGLDSGTPKGRAHAPPNA
jgi:hypothetical protein